MGFWVNIALAVLIVTLTVMLWEQHGLIGRYLELLIAERHPGW